MIAATDDNKPRVVSYVPAGPTVRAFHNEHNALFRGLLGPVGSSKSTACMMEIVHRGFRQKPGPDGWRRTRWAVVREDYPKLISTTLTTFEEWWQGTGIFNVVFSAPIEGTLLFEDAKVCIELFFLSIKLPKDVDKLKSMLLTGVWFNEASEIWDKKFIDVALDRVGRYPRIADGGPSWRGVIADTNAPDTDHWWYTMAEELRPAEWKFFRQPGGVKKVAGIWVPNPKAENIPNLDGGFAYYTRKLGGASEDHISVFYAAQYGRVGTGRPCYPHFDETKHVAQAPLQVYEALPLLLGWDFGRTPAVAVEQITPRGQLRTLREIVVDPEGTGMGLRRFCTDHVRPYMNAHFPQFKIINTFDPSGSWPGQHDETSLADVLRSEGFGGEPARSNDPDVRLEDVDFFLKGMVEGTSGMEPASLLDPSCIWLKRGYKGGYCFARMAVSGVKYRDTPDKNKFSHIHDGHQYNASTARHSDVKSTPRSQARPVENPPNRWGA